MSIRRTDRVIPEAADVRQQGGDAPRIMASGSLRPGCPTGGIRVVSGEVIAFLQRDAEGGENEIKQGQLAIPVRRNRGRGYRRVPCRPGGARSYSSRRETRGSNVS